MKKIKIIIIVAALLSFLMTQTAFASTVNFETLEQTIKLLDIMVGDESGNMKLENNVTRAEFAKMVIKASQFKDKVTEESNLSVFKDVKYDYWAAGYINAVVNEKWFTGYVDGTFKPNNTMKFEEAATVILRLLGYKDEDFAGVYPLAQISKFNYLGLNKNINLQNGRDLTRKDCMYLFYNLMQAKTKNGDTYAKTLGYVVNDSGELEQSSLLLGKMSNPIVVYNNSWVDILPFSIDEWTVYKDGNKSDLSSIKTYDVVYCNESLKSIWVYSKKIIGAYTSAFPNTASPKEITIAGNKYAVGTSEAVYKLSDMGEIKIGDTVVLLLGMDGSVVDVISGNNFNSVKCGIVIKSDKIVSIDGKVTNKITVACTDGTVQEYDVKLGFYDVGKAVAINYTNGDIKIESHNKGGNFSSYKLADNIEILDVNSNGDYKIIYKNRLKDAVLNENNVLYYTLNSNNQIDKLILNDTTGDLYDYGIVTEVEEVDEKTPEGNWIMNGSYKYILGDKDNVYNTTNMLLNISSGPSMIEYKGKAVDGIKNLTKTKITSINKIYALSDAQKYMLADNVWIYLNKNGSYYLTELSNVLDLNKFTLNGFYDDSFKLGRRIRVIIAEEKYK